MRYLLGGLLFASLSISAAPLTSITITGIPSGGNLVQWDTPVGGSVSDVWRQVGPTFGSYAANQLNVNAGASGTLNLRLEGFGGFAFLAGYGTITGYQIDVTHGLDTLSLSCTVAGLGCSSAASTTLNGLTISNLQMTQEETNIVGAFATGAAPGSGPNTSDIAVSFEYSAAAVPEPATIGMIAAGLLGLGLLRRR